MPEKNDRTVSVQQANKTLEVSQAVVRTEQAKRWTKKYRTEIAASTSSLCSTFASYPLDSVKTRMQAYNFDSFTNCVRHTFKTEGYYGFYRGVLSPLASITLVRTISFSIYQKSKYFLDDWIYRSTGNSPLKIANTPGALPCLSTITCFGISGALAGAGITAIACPFELTKLSSQISVLMAEQKNQDPKHDNVRKSYQNLGTFRTAQNLVKHRGFRGLYSGFHLHMLRDTVGTGIYFVTYESAKQLLANARGDGSPTTPVAVVTAGGLCGLVSWACIFPIDTVKSMYQRNCLTSGGDKASQPKIQFNNPRMYRGLGVSMARSCVLNAIFFSVFEFSKKHINSMDVDEQLLRDARI